MNSYFSVREPEPTAETPVVVEVPHAGLAVDALSLAFLTAPARSIGRDADLYVDELFADAPRAGATLLTSHVSRYVCDLNRSEDEVDGNAVEGASARRAPHGLIWRSTTEGVPAMARPLPRSELDRRLVELYRPYHGALRALLDAKRRRFGFAILLCGHSMPSRSLGDSGELRADVVPGSQGKSTAAPELVELPEVAARARGWSVAHDQPYRGGFTTRHYGRPSSRVHALQIELSRRLYMDERRLTKRPEGFAATAAFCFEVVERAGRLRL